MNDLMLSSGTTVVRLAENDTVRLSKPGRGLAPRCYGMTDPGRVRDANEDQFLIATLNKALTVWQASMSRTKVRHGHDQALLLVVADGMGGHAAGEHASALGVSTVEDSMLDGLKWFYQPEGEEGDLALQQFQAALAQADARIRGEASQHLHFHGMGTTLTLAYSQGDRLLVAHAGDSRCYLFRGGALHRLTQDHTLVAELMRRGALQPEEAANHPMRGLITNVVGGREEGVRVDVHKAALRAGDVVLLCTDGLTDMVPDAQIAAVLAQHPDPAASCQRLVALANERGGRDNITVIVTRYQPPDAAAG
jgi:protein phosphatase